MGSPDGRSVIPSHIFPISGLASDHPVGPVVISWKDWVGEGMLMYPGGVDLASDQPTRPCPPSPTWPPAPGWGTELSKVELLILLEILPPCKGWGCTLTTVVGAGAGKDTWTGPAVVDVGAWTLTGTTLGSAMVGPVPSPVKPIPVLLGPGYNSASWSNSHLRFFLTSPKVYRGSSGIFSSINLLGGSPQVFTRSSWKLSSLSCLFFFFLVFFSLFLSGVIFSPWTSSITLALASSGTSFCSGVLWVVSKASTWLRWTAGAWCSSGVSGRLLLMLLVVTAKLFTLITLLSPCRSF